MRLSLTVAQDAAETWRAHVTPDNASRMALLAPQLDASVQDGSLGSPAQEDSAATFTASSVWASRLQSMVSKASMSESSASLDVEECTRIMARISSADVTATLIHLKPTVLETGPGLSASGTIPLASLHALLTAAASALRSRVLRALSSAASPGERAKQQMTPAHELRMWRQLVSRLAHVQALSWLHSHSTRADGGEAYAELLRSWAGAGGDAAAELEVRTPRLHLRSGA